MVSSHNNKELQHIMRVWLRPEKDSFNIFPVVNRRYKPSAGSGFSFDVVPCGLSKEITALHVVTA